MAFKVKTCKKLVVTTCSIDYNYFALEINI